MVTVVRLIFGQQLLLTIFNQDGVEWIHGFWTLDGSELDQSGGVAAWVGLKSLTWNARV